MMMADMAAERLSGPTAVQRALRVDSDVPVVEHKADGDE
jgi:hypothetical protein